MARADILLDLVRAGAKGEQLQFRKALEALIAEERAKQHHILADRLSGYVHPENGKQNGAPSFRGSAYTDLFYEVTPEKRLSDLLLPPAVEKACRELTEEQARADLLRSHNLEPRHRLLLVGPPGNGKTSLATALAAELAVPLIVVKYESVIASYLGETAVRLSRLFDQVRTRQCVLFFDEFDVVGKERGDVHETGEIKRVVSSLLLQIDALPSYVVVATATNHPELLDRAVWRRFQLRMELPRPSGEQAIEWFTRLGSQLGVNLGHKPETLARALSGASFSELEDFSTDLRRRFVLSLPNADLKQIVSDLMDQWTRRLSVSSTDQEQTDARATSPHSRRTW